MVLAAACQGTTEAEERAATFTGWWAGEPWAGSASAVVARGGTAGDTLHLHGSSPARPGAMREQWLWISIAPFHGVGTYALSPAAVRFMDIDGGDVIGSTYGGRGPVAGTLEVIAYDGDSTIAGTVRFETEAPPRGRAPYGPRASFENGVFHAPLATPIGVRPGG
jgi:hypothetical protein